MVGRHTLACRLGALATVLFASLLLAASALAAGSESHHGHAKKHKPKPPPPPEVPLPPSGGAVGVAVTMPPVGLSIEYPVMAAQLGTGACAPQSLISELERLGSPPIELAGDSQDMTAPPGVLSGAPSSWEEATLYSLPATFWNQLHCLLASTKDPLTAGLNLKTGKPSWAAQIADEAQAAATNGLSFSLGNEPDLYYLPNNTSVGKPVTGEETVATNLYLKLAGALAQALGAVPIIGPELARPSNWQHAFAHVLTTLHTSVVGVHMYPLSTCSTPRAVTIKGLLSEGVGDAPHRMAWVVTAATAAGLPAIISEANSASCGGEAGVSDSPAAGVWAARFVLSALKTGFREVRFHFSGDPYDPFIVSSGAIVTRPLEAALYALNRWLPVGSSLRTLAGVRGLNASVATAASGAVTLIFDNEGPKTAPVAIRSAGAVLVQTLTAARAGLGETTLTPTHGKALLKLAPSSIAAVSLAP